MTHVDLDLEKIFSSSDIPVVKGETDLIGQVRYFRQFPNVMSILVYLCFIICVSLFRILNFDV